MRRMRLDDWQDPSGEMVGQVVAVGSTDWARSFAAPVQLGSEASVIALTGDVQANGSPAVAVSPQGDAVYVAFATHQPGATHSDIVVAASRDRGRTWGTPVTATPADGVTYFQPNLAVDAGGPGRPLRVRPGERPRESGPARLRGLEISASSHRCR